MVRYDASAGSVTFRVEVWDAAFWGERLAEEFCVGSSCAEGSFIRFFPRRSLHPEALIGHVRAHPKNLLAEPEVTGSATLKRYAGEAQRIGTFDGRHFEITFTSSAFRNRNWRCAATYLTEKRRNSYVVEYRDFELGGWPKPRHKRGPQR
jgi:hypothetical protein